MWMAEFGNLEQLQPHITPLAFRWRNVFREGCNIQVEFTLLCFRKKKINAEDYLPVIREYQPGNLEHDVEVLPSRIKDAQLDGRFSNDRGYRLRCQVQCRLTSGNTLCIRIWEEIDTYQGKLERVHYASLSRCGNLNVIFFN